MTRSSDVLPEPEGPSSATSSPLSTVRLTSDSAANEPNRFETERTSIFTGLSPA